MLACEVIEDPTAAAVALDPIRSRLLAEHAVPASAAELAARYHDETAPGGRRHRVVVLAHPLPNPLGEPPSSRPTE
jgi:hypothetical protein